MVVFRADPVRKLQIAVIGYNKECSEVARNLAFQAGQKIASAGAVLVCGGLGGVMESACRGAKEKGGTTVGIIPQDEFSFANQFCDIVVCTGIGYARDFIFASSADGIVAIGGGAGTLIEMSAGYMINKPVVAVAGSGGVSDDYAGKYLDERKRIMIAQDAESAVEMIVRMNESRTG
jgi:uncharacterized protein (TIGR00725 family)